MDYAQQFNAAMLSVVKTGRRFARRVSRHLRRAEGWQLIAYAVAALLVGSLLLPAFVGLAMAAVVVALVLAWAHEFVFLMRLDESVFPGRHDRLIWIAVMLVLPPLGVIAFWLYRRAQWPAAKPSRMPDDDWN